MDCRGRNALLFIVFEFLRKVDVLEPPKNLPAVIDLKKVRVEELIFFIPRQEAVRQLLTISASPDVSETERKRARIALMRCFDYEESRNGHGV